MDARSSLDVNAFGPFTNPYQVYFLGLQSLSQGFEPVREPLKAVAQSQLEVLGLLSRRSQAMMEFPSRLARCRTPKDLLDEQANFWTTAFQQFSESGQRIMEAWAQIVPEGFTGASARAERDYIAFPAPKDAGSQHGPRGQRRRVA